MLKIGGKIPDLVGTSTGAESMRLGDFAGKFVVVYFYPKDNTGGCTSEAQEFRDLHARFTRAGAVILGVSRDSLKSHAGFRSKQSLPFDLIADTDETWCKAFDVIHEKVLYGRKYVGIVRSTFLIDPERRLRHEWRAVKVKEHAAAVLAALVAEKK